MTLQQLRYVVMVADTGHDHRGSEPAVYIPAKPDKCHPGSGKRDGDKYIQQVK